MKIAFCASEVYPFAKTGGLADVAGSLPLALGRLGHEVLIIMPRYRGLRREFKKISQRVRILFVKHRKYFERQGIYGSVRGDYRDNAKRFSFFCQKTLDLLKQHDFKPDILHLNDWHTALMSVYLKTHYAHDSFFKKTKTLFTIHNLAFQGLFAAKEFACLDFKDARVRKAMEFYGRISFMKAGLLYSDVLSTVSHTYAKEIQTTAHGCGLERILQRRRRKLFGILNGLDTHVWNPSQDQDLTQRYSVKTIQRKARNKAFLQKKCRLPLDPRVPIFGMVTRLTEQKGLDVLLQSFQELMKRRLQLVILGTGEARYEAFLSKMKKRYAGRFSPFLEFAGFKAHLIYGGCDYFLMPSRFEPCGLGQMISFRYGTVPIARRTGGLADSIVDGKNGNGLLFEDYNKRSFLKAVDRALALYQEPKRFQAFQARGMRLDYSWDHSAKEYVGLYRKMVKVN